MWILGQLVLKVEVEVQSVLNKCEEYCIQVCYKMLQHYKDCYQTSKKKFNNLNLCYLQQLLHTVQWIISCEQPGYKHMSQCPDLHIVPPHQTDKLIPTYFSAAGSSGTQLVNVL